MTEPVEQDNTQLIKYPRTRHIQGSRLQPGDEDLDSVPLETIKGRTLVIEEKMDGANSAISFSQTGDLHLQSRGHFLTGGTREKHFALFKQWAQAHRRLLWEVLGSRYIAYGEWLYAKHTIFYDRLPHYWLEFDIYDRQRQQFLSTPRRSDLLRNSPIVSVMVVLSGTIGNTKQLAQLVAPSQFIAQGHLERLQTLCEAQGLDAERTLRETDSSLDMEGLYIKIEEGSAVIQRYKFIRPSFLTSVLDSQGHWINRPIVPNQLLAGVDLFGG